MLAGILSILLTTVCPNSSTDQNNKFSWNERIYSAFCTEMARVSPGSGLTKGRGGTCSVLRPSVFPLVAKTHFSLLAGERE